MTKKEIQICKNKIIKLLISDLRVTENDLETAIKAVVKGLQFTQEEISKQKNAQHKKNRIDTVKK